jgi:hypothetical protein
VTDDDERTNAEYQAISARVNQILVFFNTAYNQATDEAQRARLENTLGDEIADAVDLEWIIWAARKTSGETN